MRVPRQLRQLHLAFFIFICFLAGVGFRNIKVLVRLGMQCRHLRDPVVVVARRKRIPFRELTRVLRDP